MKLRIVVAALCLVTMPSLASPQLVEGRDYVTIDARPVNPDERVEVIQFFYYGCESCYLLEPLLREWVARRATQIDFSLIPALRRSSWVPLSDLFFALHSLGALPQLHHRVYIAIHEQNRRLSSRREQIMWVSEHGVDPVAFELELDSDATMIATQQAHDATLAYGIRATPSLVIDGRYLTTGEMIGKASRVTYVLDGLLEIALMARGSAFR
ncbi:MAG: thiol:disulfide interchange protein DsbA/DsbL [Betaproteobacteria bacterium]|jgi:thiol:disulfide interchange protein DsbA|nr:MAG: thiol:disulfide interchange protein DsbA/DsbL [Betaproteobacteria bacterium]